MPRGSGDVGFVHMGDGHDDERQALADEGYGPRLTEVGALVEIQRDLGGNP